MSGVAILGLAALSALLAVNIAIAVAAVILGRRRPACWSLAPATGQGQCGAIPRSWLTNI
jgi:hypothetical protein